MPRFEENQGGACTGLVPPKVRARDGVSVLRDTCRCSHDGNYRGRFERARPEARVGCGSEDADSHPDAFPAKYRAGLPRPRRQIPGVPLLLGVGVRNTEEVDGERSR